jgi:acyl carrier protein
LIRPFDPYKQSRDWPEDVPGQIDRILVSLFELEAAAVTPQARIREDLDLDSLDGVDIVVAIEKHFGFISEEDTLARMRTVGEIHTYVESKLASRSS